MLLVLIGCCKVSYTHFGGFYDFIQAVSEQFLNSFSCHLILCMSTYIDLFSGIGGFAQALQNISQPRLNCDIEQSSQQVLIKLIKHESLPPAPVIYDVKDVRKAVMPDLLFHMIASGFPCIGFSAAGQRKGFMNKHSSLFYELLRITKEFGPKLVFIENTPQIVASGGMHVIAVEFGKLAYDLDWIVLPAYSVGAHHASFRWYCLASKRGYKPGLPHTLIFGFGYVTIRRIIGPDVNTRINTHSVNTFLHRNNGNRR